MIERRPAEPDTPAANLPGHLSADVMEARRDQLMQVQQSIVFDRKPRWFICLTAAISSFESIGCGTRSR